MELVRKLLCLNVNQELKSPEQNEKITNAIHSETKKNEFVILQLNNKKFLHNFDDV